MTHVQDLPLVFALARLEASDPRRFRTMAKISQQPSDEIFGDVAAGLVELSSRHGAGPIYEVIVELLEHLEADE